MYNTTTALAAALATQKLYTKVVYGATTIGAEQVKKCVYSGSFGGMDTVTIGGVTAAMVTLTLSGAHDLRDKTIAVSVGADVSGTVQYVPLGTFVVATCKQVDDTTTVTAYDAAYYALGGTYTPNVSSGATVAAVLSDMATQCGLTLATLPAAASTTNVVGDLTGKTCRDMVSYLAALVGCNALIDRDGKLALRWFAASGQSYSPSDYYNAGLSIDGTSTLACIRAEVETTTTDADGNTSVTTNAYTAGGTGVGISIQNPYMTQVILDAVWASIGGLAYTVGNCDIFHGLLTEPGDLVTITDKAGVAHTLAVMSLELSIDGGCKTTLRATGESTTDAGAAMQGSLGGKVSQLVVDLAKVKQLIIEDVNGVTKIYGGRIDTKSLFAQDITASGRIKSANYNGAESTPLENTEGSILKMDDGTFNFAGGKLVYDGTNLVLDGKIKGEAIDIEAGDATGKIRLYSEYVVDEETGAREYPRFEIVAQGDTSESRVVATPPELNLYSRSVGVNAGVGGVVIGGSYDSETGNYVTAIYLRGVTTITGGPAEINVGNNSVEITAGQQPDDASIDPYVQIGKFGEGVYLLGDIYINNVRPYYTAGDTVTIERMYCAGGVTGSGTNLYFYIPLAKPLIGVSAVTISNPTKAIITARKVEGGYIAQDATVSALGTPSCVPYENGVTIAIKASSAYNTKNNTPVTVTPENLVLKFT